MAKQSEKEFLLITYDIYTSGIPPVSFRRGKTEKEGLTPNVEDAHVFTGAEVVEMLNTDEDYYKYSAILKGEALSLATLQISPDAWENRKEGGIHYRPARAGEITCKHCYFRDRELTKSFNYKHSTCRYHKENTEKLTLSYTCNLASKESICPICKEKKFFENADIVEFGCFDCQMKKYKQED